MADEGGERLQKFLARCNLGSRRRCEDLITGGRVLVNGQPAVLGQKVDPAKDHVRVDGRRVQPDAERIVVMLHKMPGTMTTKEDPENRPTVMRSLPPALRKRLYPVGRLDFHTEGLLLLTNDGELALHLTHPRYKLEKTYLAKVRGVPKAADLERLRNGIVLDGRRTLPCRIFVLEQDRSSHTWIKILLREGKKNQIREMFFRIGCPVMRLRRTHVGPLALGALPRGEWRQLHPEEIQLLERALKAAAAGRTQEVPRVSAPEPIAARVRKSRPAAPAKESEPPAPLPVPEDEADMPLDAPEPEVYRALTRPRGKNKTMGAVIAEVWTARMEEREEERRTGTGEKKRKRPESRKERSAPPEDRQKRKGPAGRTSSRGTPGRDKKRTPKVQRKDRRRGR